MKLDIRWPFFCTRAKMKDPVEPRACAAANAPSAVAPSSRYLVELILLFDLLALAYLVNIQLIFTYI